MVFEMAVNMARSRGHETSLSGPGSVLQAAMAGSLSRVKLCLDRGVDVNTRGADGRNLLMTSLLIENDAQRGKVFGYLLRRGADVTYVDRSTGRDVLAWAALLGRADQVHRILAARPGDIPLDRGDREGCTPLHHATRGGHVDVVRHLVAALAKYHLAVDVPDKHGLTPYIYARRGGHDAVAAILLGPGHCSPRQFDTQTFRTVTDWAEVGVTERKQEARRGRLREQARAKILGRLPPPGGAADTPGLAVSDSRPLSLPRIDVSVQGAAGRHGGLGVRPSSVASGSMAGHCSPETYPLHRLPLLKPQRVSRHPSPVAMASSARRGGRDPFNKSVDTAYALLDMKADVDVTSGIQPTRFVGSELDTSKLSEYGGSAGHLTHFMEIASDQRTDAFRQVARAPTPPPPPPVRKAAPDRKKVSTLAILLGKDKRSRQTALRQRRKTLVVPAAKAPRGSKTGTGRERKRKTTSTDTSQ